MSAENAPLTGVSFETTCFAREGDTVASLDVVRKLRHVAELQRLVARKARGAAAAETLHPSEISALLFQGAHLVTAHSDGELLGYAIVAKQGAEPLCELLVSPRAAYLPLGSALLERLAEAAQS